MESQRQRACRRTSKLLNELMTATASSVSMIPFASSSGTMVWVGSFVTLGTYWPRRWRTRGELRSIGATALAGSAAGAGFEVSNGDTRNLLDDVLPTIFTCLSEVYGESDFGAYYVQHAAI